MEGLYSKENVYNLESLLFADKKNNITSFLLMQRAGFCLFKSIPKEDLKHTFIFIGSGNNGGDGIVCASFLKQFGFDVTVIHLIELDKLQNDAKNAYEIAKLLDINFEKFNEKKLLKNIKKNDVIVDAIFGIGLSREVKGIYFDAIQLINQINNFVVSCDIPSGLCSNTGSVLGKAVMADITCSFIARKKGLFTEIASDYVGKFYFNDLQTSAYLSKKIKPSAQLLTEKFINNQKKERKNSSHKGSMGHVVIIAGDHAMGGAGLLNAISALKNGCGKVTLITRENHVSASLSYCPEVMVKGFEIDEKSENNKKTKESLKFILDQSNVILIGSGMDQNLAWSKYFFDYIIDYKKKNSHKKFVFDAGMLRYIAKNKITKLKNCILTPHLGEASALLNLPTKEIQVNRFSSIDHLVKKFQAAIILKGKGTMIKGIESKMTYLCPIGNSYLATAGSGDILAGMVASFIAQGYELEKAAQTAVWYHALKADQLVLEGKVPLIASELVEN